MRFYEVCVLTYQIILFILGCFFFLFSKLSPCLRNSNGFPPMNKTQYILRFEQNLKVNRIPQTVYNNKKSSNFNAKYVFLLDGFQSVNRFVKSETLFFIFRWYFISGLYDRVVIAFFHFLERFRMFVGKMFKEFERGI